MYGARAVLKQIVEAYPSDAVSVHVVWMPMVPGDSLRAARKTGRMFASSDVHQYYDEERAVGLACHRDAFSGCLTDAARATPKDHPLYETLVDWAEGGRGEGPLWDAVLFYPPGVEWSEVVPAPRLWAKQVAFLGPDAGEVTATFFRNDCDQPPVDSDWHREVRQAMATLLDAND